MTKFQPTRLVGGITNQKRAEDAMTVVAAFSRSQGLQGETLNDIVGDLLCDILHLAAAAGYEPDEFLNQVSSKAWGHYTSEATLEPHEGDTEPDYLVEPWFNDMEDGTSLCDVAPRYYVVSGRLPGDDDDSVAYITIPTGEKRSPWEVFVEEELGGGFTLYTVDDWKAYYDECGNYPQEGLPEDWNTRNPTETERAWGVWAYDGVNYEVPGPEVLWRPKPTVI